MIANHTFLLISQAAETQWSLILRQALSPLGELCVLSEEETTLAIAYGDYDTIIIDAGMIQDITQLVSHLLSKRPELCVIVATASPTWKRAREAFQAGAADYIRKSLDAKELRVQIQAALEATLLPRSH